MTDEKISFKGNGTSSALTMIVFLFAVIAGVYAMMEPMGQRVTFLTDQLQEMRTKIEKNGDKAHEHNSHVRGLNAAQWERIRALEREVFRKPLPISIGAGEGSEIQY